MARIGRVVAVAAATILASAQICPANAADESIVIDAFTRNDAGTSGRLTGTVTGACGSPVVVKVFYMSLGPLGTHPEPIVEVPVRGGTFAATVPYTGGTFAAHAFCGDEPGWDVSTAIPDTVDYPSLVTVSASEPRVGESITMTSDSFRPGEHVVVSLADPDGIPANWSARGAAGKNGRVSVTVVLPEQDAHRGRYELEMIGVSSRHRAMGSVLWGNGATPDATSTSIPTTTVSGAPKTSSLAPATGWIPSSDQVVAPVNRPQGLPATGADTATMITVG